MKKIKDVKRDILLVILGMIITALISGTVTVFLGYIVTADQVSLIRSDRYVNWILEQECLTSSYFTNFNKINELSDYWECELLKEGLYKLDEKYEFEVIGNVGVFNKVDSEALSITGGINNPILVKENDNYVSYGFNSQNRTLEKLTPDGRVINMGNIDVPMQIKFDFLNPSVYTYNVLDTSEYGTFATYENEYAIFKEGKKISSFNVGEELEFPEDGWGIAKGIDTGTAYMIRYTSKQIDIEKIAENVQSVKQEQDGGLCSFEKDSETYLVIPSNESYLKLGALPSNQYVRVCEGSYNIVQDKYENYDYLSLTENEYCLYQVKYCISIGNYVYTKEAGCNITTLKNCTGFKKSFQKYYTTYDNEAEILEAIRSLQQELRKWLCHSDS